MTRVPRRLVARTLLASAVVLLGAIAVAVTPGAANASVARSAAATAPVPAHPYSAPVWWPVHAKVYVDCVKSNPGCGDHHGVWTMDVVQETLPAGTASTDLGVYAMGAGQLHVVTADGTPCSDSGQPANFGTSVAVDHGGGVTSRYGHLASIDVPDGTWVTAGERIGTMGTTGKNGNCSVPYLDFQVRSKGAAGPLTEFQTWTACAPNGGAAQTWPTALNATAIWRPRAPKFPRPTTATYYNSWNDVPQRSVDIPATTSSCIPSATPATAVRPTGVGITRSGSDRLTVRWNAPAAAPAVRTVQVQLSQFHPSTRTWDYTQHATFVTTTPDTVFTAFANLVSGHTYRATVSFETPAGWSRASTWVSTTAAK
jgi:hypothetical protein